MTLKLLRAALAATALLVLPIFLGSRAQAEPPGQPDSDKAVLASLLDEFLAGASINDAAIHNRFWAKDLIYTSSSGRRFGKAELMLSVGGAEPADPEPAIRYRAEAVDIRLFGNTAVVAFTLVADDPTSDRDLRYYNTGTFVRREQQWRAVAWQATRIPMETEPKSP
ncbi:MAG: nuclear transport factor 2 family protein [Xanthomonadales bacterium]|nr:nuclear transport factor 2 family protein [Xanthomonadales bacterium]